MIKLAWEDAYDWAVLVSLDRDFIPAAELLTAKGRKVLHAGFPPRGSQPATKCWGSLDLRPPLAKHLLVQRASTPRVTVEVPVVRPANAVIHVVADDHAHRDGSHYPHQHMTDVAGSSVKGSPQDGSYWGGALPDAAAERPFPPPAATTASGRTWAKRRGGRSCRTGPPRESPRASTVLEEKGIDVCIAPDSPTCARR